MNAFKTCALFALLLPLPACGQQLVEFADAGAEAGSTDTTGDPGDDDSTELTDTDPGDDDPTEPTDTDPGDDDPTDSDPADDAGATNTTDGDPGGDAGPTDATDTEPSADAGPSDTDPDGSGATDTELNDAAATDPSESLPDDDVPTGPEPTDAGSVDASDAAAGDAADLDGSTDASDASELDASLPTVVLTNPANAAVEVSIAKTVTATFSEPMDGTTLDESSFMVELGAVLVPGMVSYVGTVASFVPDNDLAPGQVYTATITTAAEDLNGNALAQDTTWSFTTSACGQSLVDLGAAGTFAVLAGSTVTSSGPTSVTGDLGVSPGTAVVGFPPGILLGTQHAGDPTAAQGIADLTTAYNDAAGRTLCAVTVNGNMGGQTLPPGLYASTSSLEISSGDLTLDAQGDADAVFIFQMASTLTTTAGRQVILSGGAQASNVFWQVGTSATLGTTSAFQGTIMADQAITLNNGATLNGRVLARIAAVSLDSNSIVTPAP